MTGKEVLDTEKYPEIRFTSRVKEAKKTGDGWEVMLEGRLSPTASRNRSVCPSVLAREPGSCVRSGEASLLHTDFGITPIRVGGGTVKVEDKIRIRFDVVADALGPEWTAG